MSNPIEPLNKLSKKRHRPALFLSGFVVALSFVVNLIPLALYSVAQISAMLGKRVGLFLMICVFVALFVASLLFESPSLYFSALSILCALPFFMVAIFIREKKRSKYAAAFVLWAPFLLFLASFLYLPQLNSQQVDMEVAKIEKALTDKQTELKKQIESDVSKSSQQQIAEVYKNAITQVHDLADNKEIRNFLSFNFGERLVWFTYGDGSVFLFFGFLICFANLVFLDLAFEQTDKMKAVIGYVLKNVPAFSLDFVLALSQMPLKIKQNSFDNFQIIKHELRRTENSYDAETNDGLPKIAIFKAPKPANRVFLKGYSFVTEGTLFSWGLKNFSVPFPLKIIALALPFSVVVLFGGIDGILAFTAKSPLQSVVGLMSFLSFAIITLLTLEGFFVFYSRVSNFIVVTLLFAFLLLGTNLTNGYLILVALFGSISLLDNLYNWRQKGQRP